jgi:ABC-2 type transport system ATP-binding protein
MGGMSMENVLEIEHLRKDFKTFSLKDISFSLPKGYIMGFIGPNGAGKTTTLKLIMNLLYKDSGSIKVFGLDHAACEREIKQRVGFVHDQPVYYEQLSIKQMTGLLRPFYTRWDEGKYQGYIRRFDLDPAKKIKELSKGMKTKYSLALALCHGAELLIMDEPTSGLDPIFRRELLDILYEVIQQEENSILFSSHITSDLDRIADYITFLHDGRLVLSEEKDALLSRFMLVKGGPGELTEALKKDLIGFSQTPVGFEGLANGRLSGTSLVQEKPSLEDIMFYYTKGRTYVK